MGIIDKMTRTSFLIDSADTQMESFHFALTGLRSLTWHLMSVQVCEGSSR